MNFKQEDSFQGYAEEKSSLVCFSDELHIKLLDKEARKKCEMLYVPFFVSLELCTCMIFLPRKLYVA